MMMLTLNDGQAVMVVVAIVVAMIALCYGLILSIKHERKNKVKETLISQGILDVSAFNYFLNQRQKVKKTAVYYTLSEISFDNADVFSTQIDEADFLAFLLQRSKIVLRSLPYGSKVCIDEKNRQLFIYIPKIVEQHDLEKLLIKVKHELEQTYVVFEQLTINPVVTVTYAYYPDHGSNYEQIINALSIASYHAGKLGGNMIKGYASEMAKNKQFIEYYYQLKEAIKNKEFRFDYQPIINIENHKIYGAEALLRWNHPTQGILGPNQFMKTLEQSGDIDWISIWGLETAIQTLDKYKNHTGIESFKAHLNLSPRQLLNENIVVKFQNIITKLRFPASDIVLELLDFNEFSTNEQFIKTVIRLQSIGFQVAIDITDLDYQMMTLIEKLNIKVIKLSRRFMLLENSDMKNKFLNDLIEFAGKQRRILIAEGIENIEQETELKKRTIQYAQGYAYGEPKDERSLFEFKVQ